MKDKEIIEEMARTFCPYGDNAIIHQSCELCKQVLNGDCDCFRNAKKLYNKLFPKDDIVLSKEKYELLVECSSYEGVMKALKNEYTKGSKETAEKILNFLEENRHKYEMWYLISELRKYFGIEQDNSWVFGDLADELAKQFGVEIKE